MGVRDIDIGDFNRREHNNESKENFSKSIGNGNVVDRATLPTSNVKAASGTATLEEFIRKTRNS